MKYLRIAMAFLFLTISSCKTGESEKSIKTPTQQELINPKTNNLEGDTLVLNKKDSINTKYKINNLPISYNYENDFMQIALPVTWANIKIDSIYEDEFLAFLPKKEQFQPVIYTGVYSYGNKEEYIIVLSENNKEISRIKVLYSDAEDDYYDKDFNNTIYEIDENYIIKIITYRITENPQSGKSVEKKISEKSYIINKDGLIVQK